MSKNEEGNTDLLESEINEESVANEGIQIPGEGGEPEHKDETEVLAREKGWRPEKEFEGEKAQWVSADEFLKREPLFDRIKSQSKDLKVLRKSMEALVKHNTKQINAGVQKELARLKANKKEAIELGDVSEVEKIDAQINAQNESAKQNEINEPPSELTEWVDENPWFMQEEEMNLFAIAHNKEYIKKHPGDIGDSLKATKTAVEKAYPDFFNASTEEKEKKVKKQPMNPVEGSDGEPKDTSGGKKGYNMSRLSSDQKLVYNQMVKVHKELSHEEYFKSLDDIGELS